MIRRDSSPGQPPHWILVSQIDHAHLAGRLAEEWGAPHFAPLEPRERLVWAIFHHDDGWRAWDESPGLDPQSGRPRSFTEMLIDDSLAIWTQSIATALSAGPLETYVVAGHFCALARRGAAWRSGDPRWPAVEQFLATHESLMDTALCQWQSQAPGEHTAEMAQRALGYLQFFDSLSLWFCCSEAGGEDRVVPPGGAELTLAPLDSTRVSLAPWPFGAERVNLEVRGRSVPAVPYGSPGELARAAQPVSLHWQLQPGRLSP